MKKYLLARFLASGFVCIFITSNVFAQCATQDRIDLAKAGYSKVEIETICASAPTMPAKAKPKLESQKQDPVSVLKAAKYVSSEDPALGGMWHPRNQCEFLDDQVKLNNIKKTFGGYKSTVIPYANFWAGSQMIRADRDKGIVSGVIHLTAMGALYGNESCYAMLDRRMGVAPDKFDATEVEVRTSFKQVLEALGSMSVDLKDPHQ